MSRNNLVIGMWTTAAVLGLYGLLALVLLVANTYALPAPGPATVMRLNIGFTVFAALAGVGAFAVLCGVGIADRLARRPVSALYGPLLTFAGFWCVIGTILALNGLDRLVHDLRLHWMLTTAEPEMQIINSLIIVGAYISMGWAASVILAGRDWHPLMIWMLIGGVTGVAALITIAAFVWTA